MKLPISKLGLGAIVLATLTAVSAVAQQSIATLSATPLLSAANSSPDSLAAADPNVELISTPSASSALVRGAALPLKPQPTTKPSENQPSLGEVRIWKGLIIAQHSAAAFDAWSTRRSIESGNGYERNVLMRPFANSAAIYPILQIAPFGFDFVSHRMMRSQSRIFRKTWWLPQAASTAASLWCGSRNLRVASLKR